MSEWQWRGRTNRQTQEYACGTVYRSEDHQCSMEKSAKEHGATEAMALILGHVPDPFTKNRRTSEPLKRRCSEVSMELHQSSIVKITANQFSLLFSRIHNSTVNPACVITSSCHSEVPIYPNIPHIPQTFSPQQVSFKQLIYALAVCPQSTGSV